MRIISAEELAKILMDHELWLKVEGGKCADLNDTNLKGVDLSNTDLTSANLNNAYLSNANLSNARLTNVNLRCAYLADANLSGANLIHADLRCATLISTNLEGANLTNANLLGADLRCSKTKNVKTSIYTVGYDLACPETGSFIGYKKADGCLVELLIPEDAKRSSATTKKCRCDKAKVLAIVDIDTGEPKQIACSNYDSSFIYKVGETVSVDDFEEDRWSECASGIHFFINKYHAINY